MHLREDLQDTTAQYFAIFMTSCLTMTTSRDLHATILTGLQEQSFVYSITQPRAVFVNTIVSMLFSDVVSSMDVGVEDNCYLWNRYMRRRLYGILYESE